MVNEGASAALDPQVRYSLYRLIYSGCFSPITIGHMDLIQRASGLCDELLVAVLNSGSKDLDLTLEDRKLLVERAIDCQGLSNQVRVISFDGLLADLYREEQAQAVVRGLRSPMDYDYEVPMVAINRELNPDFETIFLQAKPELAHVSSSLIREMRRLGQDYQNWLPPGVYELLQTCLSKGERG